VEPWDGVGDWEEWDGYQIEHRDYAVTAQINTGSIDPDSPDWAAIIAEINDNLWNPHEAEREMPVTDVTHLYQE